MKITVGTTPVKLPYAGRVTPMIQNLGPGNVYFDSDQNVSSATGVMLNPGAVYESPRDISIGGGTVYLVADTAGCDVRTLRVG